jgi:ferredoxin--NADP+ reductase
VFEGRVTNYIKEKLNNIDNNDLFFLCGNSLMVSEVHEILITNNINNNQIFSEIFF